ncbi:hypothetical protein BCR41DRAFT_355955 [Lobosporangium transversale]|uniref:Small ribosomal subunit protein bS18m n=1 Tax=Lobosporangium transversale TaxID=64571 RepID=A0A1Y2GJN4_9FUNG|nr:hypothetical protein BCR41DRAFT_355955 [Lobosporangium transversale]ORZ12950.1 hypothetical protein BCR41DRAFT_355955 [Lobosporangium transversale]|eukprot:XP_021880299.1 hypothetical protein BCR41DRAFT_355955 [Lobosporangium transversale]
MLPSVYRTAATKSVIKTLVPTLASTNFPAHNLVTRRFKSDSLEDEESRPHADVLMNIITTSINTHATPAAGAESFRMSRGSFRKGDTYKPSDLNDTKATVYEPPAKPVDELKILNLNPVAEYKNASLLSHYITPFGRLMSREQTGLSAKNQRRVSRAVRRARALCIISPTAKV